MIQDPQKVKDLKQLWHACFPEDSQEYIAYWFENRYDPRRALSHTEDGRIVAALHIVPYEIQLCKSQIPCGFIVGVATLPEYRNRGLAKSLMHEALLQLRQQHVALSYLSPFDFGFYRAFGYEAVSEMQRTEFSVDAFLAMYEGCGWPDQVYPFEEGQIPAMQKRYAQNMKSANSYVIRKDMEPRVREHLVDGNVIVAEKNQDLTGYALYAAGQGRCEVGEIVFSDIMCLSAMLHAIAKEQRGKKIVCMLPPGTETAFLPQPEFEVEPYIMMRIVDPLDFRMQTEVTKEKLGPAFWLKDTFIEQNEGCYRPVIDHGLLSFERCNVPDAPQISIQTLSAAVTGSAQASAADCEALGWIADVVGKQKNLIYEKY